MLVVLEWKNRSHYQIRLYKRILISIFYIKFNLIYKFLNVKCSYKEV